MVTKGYGFTVDDIDYSCPADLDPYGKAYKLKLEQDNFMKWLQGIYFHESLMSTVGNMFTKKGAKKNEYPKKPYEIYGKQEQMSEDELQKQRELFVAKLEVMKTNFELNHPKKKK